MQKIIFLVTLLSNYIDCSFFWEQRIRVRSHMKQLNKAVASDSSVSASVML